MSTFEKQYVQWVQRTLNRELDSELITDGVTTSEYREAVETFQLVHDLPLTGEVGSADQNKMIKANHQSNGYVNWAQQALYRVGARDKATTTGVMDQDTVDSVKSFQAFRNLNDDGWIGARTEIELIDGSGILPGGHIKGVGPVPRRPIRFFYDNPKQRPAVLPIDKTVSRIISTNYYDALYNRSAFSGGDRQRRVCVLGKLKQHQGIDDRYPVNAFIGYAYHGSTRYRTASSIFQSAREYLSRRVGGMRVEERLNPVAGRNLINDLMKQIEGGMRSVELYQKHLKPSEHAYFPALIGEVARLVDERQRKSSSILSCFK